MINKILIASHNQAKIKELKIGLNDLKKSKVSLLTLKDLNITSQPEESGKTFRENAILKAKYYSKISGLPAVADDGGLVIPYLNNEPGVKSRRWLGYDASDEELIQHTLMHLKGVQWVDRAAYLETCICYYNPLDHKLLYEQEKIDGQIAKKPFKNFLPGFPYRALLIINRFNKYYDALTSDEHKTVNHRFLALRKLVSKIEHLILK